MASSEGVSFRWEAFNRWCDEYADRHSGMKPKVEDVRKWHRENAEKVWPDSSERPSVFLAVSHNKGRRVRGHKTCEYYKRYRAGKAAEQQLAARLQPSALSGRRILAVTAAARKVNTDCTRVVAKRSSPDLLEEPDMEQQDADEGELHGIAHTEKRRRARAVHGPFSDAAGTSRRPGGGARGSSSDGLSDDQSWASGAGTSNDDGEDDDSGSGVMAAQPGRRCTAHPYQHPHVTALRTHANGPHAGVHITVVRRDADGRTIQVETQPARGGGPHEHGVRQVMYPYYMPAATAGAAAPGGGSGQSLRLSVSHEIGGRRLGVRRGEVGHYGSDSGAESDGAGAVLDRQQPQLRAYSWPDGGHEGGASEQSLPPLRQQSGGAAVMQGWAWAGPLGPVPAGRPGDHPGVAPPACRRARSCAEAGQRQPPRFCGYVATPLGSVPVYSVAGGGGGGLGTRAGARPGGKRTRRGPCEADGGAGSGGGAVTAAAVLVVRDPLDLLAEAACDALASPRPVGHDGDDGALATAEPGRASDAGVLGAVEGGEVTGGKPVVIAVAAEVKDEGQGAACGSNNDRDQHPKPAALERSNMEEHVSGGESANTDLAVAPRARGQGQQQQQQQDQPVKPEPGAEAAPAPAAGAVVKREPSPNGAARFDGQPADGCCDGASVGGASVSKECGAAVPAPQCGGLACASSCVVPAATKSWSGPGLGMELAAQQQQQQNSDLPVSQVAADSGVPLVHETPSLAAAAAGSAACPAVAGGDGVAVVNGATVMPACGGGSSAATDAAPAAAAAAAAAPVSASASDLPSCRLPLLAPGEFEASLLAAALGQQARLPLSGGAVGDLGLGLGALVSAAAVAPPAPPLPLPLPLTALSIAGGAAPPGALHTAVATTAAAPPLLPPPPPLLWPALTGGMGHMLAGAPALTAAAAVAAVPPLFTDASVLGGALVGGGGGGGAQLLPMMRLLQVQMASRGLDPNVCHD